MGQKKILFVLPLYNIHPCSLYLQILVRFNSLYNFNVCYFWWGGGQHPEYAKYFIQNKNILQHIL